MKEKHFYLDCARYDSAFFCVLYWDDLPCYIAIKLHYMATATQTELIAKEKRVGDKAARILQGSLVFFVHKETVENTGKLLDSSVRSKADTKGLKALIIKQPRYGFMLNYGFEGVKSNGVYMKQRATNHLADAIEKGGVLEKLADELTHIKGERVLTSINFKTRG